VNHRSGCPINLSTELLGDRWSLVVLRDIMVGNRRSYRDIMVNCEEGIASNILAARLRHFEAEGLIEVTDDPAHRQKRRISLTEKAIELVPVLALLGGWGAKHLPCEPAAARRAARLAAGGPRLWDAFMGELRHLHLGAPAPDRSVRTDLWGADAEAPEDPPLPS
jgi:DNA-binding HxlR family transcriptional regulator